MADDLLPHDDELDARLRSAVLAATPDAPAVGVLQAVEHRARRRKRRVRESIGAGVMVVLGGLGVAAYALSSGHQMAANNSPATTRPSTGIASTTSSTSAQATAASDGLGATADAPPPTPLPCPAHQLTPTTARGRYCGPDPGPGSGAGPNGTCTGSETAPPCGPGVVPGRYYAYTMPGTCSGLMTFDGQQWVAELTPPSAGADFYVWMRIDPNGSARWISTTGSVGLRPYTGQPLSGCRQ
jgi:hypothetical protein